VTFNHGVEGSSPSALTNEINYLDGNSTHPAPCNFSACTQAVHQPGVVEALRDDPDTLFAVAVADVAIIVAVGKLIERVCWPPTTKADKWT
jgi:hypothetical protein